MEKREIKDLLYEQVARVGKAVSSPKRLEMLEVLAQGEKAVDDLARELAIDKRLASAHLKVLRDARMVESRRASTSIIYRLSGDDVAGLWVRLREVAEEHLLELRIAIDRMLTTPNALARVGRAELLEQARRGEVLVIDVRPESEYQSMHLPFARSMPLAELEQRLDELPSNREIVAYCRGPFCLLSDEAVQLLSARGFTARKISDGVSEWQEAGFPVERQS